MDLTPYIDGLRRDLAAAAATGGPETAAAAERLAVALDPAVRLAVMDALSQAAAEITSELDHGSVDLRLRGREPQFVVDVPSLPAPPLAAAPPPAPEDAADDGDADATVARITLRLPEAVKARAEELAAKGGQSLNSWIVTALRAATRDRALTVDLDLASLTTPAPEPFGHPGRPDPGRRRTPRRMTGWV